MTRDKARLPTDDDRAMAKDLRAASSDEHAAHLLRQYVNVNTPPPASADAPAQRRLPMHPMPHVAGHPGPDFHGTPQGCVSGWEVPASADALGEVDGA